MSAIKEPSELEKCAEVSRKLEDAIALSPEQQLGVKFHALQGAIGDTTREQFDNYKKQKQFKIEKSQEEKIIRTVGKVFLWYFFQENRQNAKADRISLIKALTSDTFDTDDVDFILKSCTSMLTKAQQTIQLKDNASFDSKIQIILDFLPFLKKYYESMISNSDFQKINGTSRRDRFLAKVDMHFTEQIRKLLSTQSPETLKASGVSIEHRFNTTFALESPAVRASHGFDGITTTPKTGELDANHLNRLDTL